MSALNETTAILRFFGDALDPDEITSLLGQPSTGSYRKGEVWALRDGRELRRKTGSWRREAEPRTPGDVDGQVEELFSQLTQDLVVWRALSERFEGDVFCGLFMETSNDGLDLCPTTLLSIGSRGLTLEFDIYDAGPERTRTAPGGT